jgi:tripartite-type tricarboxylate transporter receptor subunit TctC
MTRFQTLAATALLGFAATLGTAQAQSFPNKPITLIVPYAAGGLTDQLAREVGQHMATVLKQPVVVDNRPGGGAQVAMNALKQAPADGHAVFFGDVPSLATNVGLFSKLSYDPRKDVQPVAQLIVSPGLFVVPMNSPYKTFADLVGAAKTLPKGLSYASQGVGTGGHLFGTLLSKHIGAGMTHVAYRGSAPGLSDVVAGQVDFMYDAIPTSGAFVRGDRLRALAIGADQRSPLLPQVPTLKELGYESIVPTFWWGVAVKAGTPPEVVERLQQVVTAAIHEPAIARKFTDQGVVVKTSTSREFTAYIDSEITRWTKVMREAGMSAD